VRRREEEEDREVAGRVRTPDRTRGFFPLLSPLFMARRWVWQKLTTLMAARAWM